MVTLRIFGRTKPVIGAINGAAVGVGVTMTLPMDIRLASDAARFGFVFARRGIVPEAASSWFLPRVVGISRPLEWCTPAACSPPTRRSPAAWCAACTPPDELLPAAREHRARDRRQHVAGLGGSGPADDVAHAGRRPPDGGAPRGQPGDARPRAQRRCPRGRHELPREAPDAVFTDRVSDGLPDVFPEWDEPEFS